MFNEKLKQLRKREKMTQQELADALGLDRTTITKYESGSFIPSAETIKKICALFNVSMDYIMDSSILPENQNHVKLDPRVRILQRAADENNLSDRELEDILNYAKYRYPDRFIGLKSDEDNKV